eukprot:IDg4507t1
MYKTSGKWSWVKSLNRRLPKRTPDFRLCNTWDQRAGEEGVHQDLDSAHSRTSPRGSFKQVQGFFTSDAEIKAVGVDPSQIQIATVFQNYDSLNTPFDEDGKVASRKNLNRIAKVFKRCAGELEQAEWHSRLFRRCLSEDGQHATRTAVTPMPAPL